MTDRPHVRRAISLLALAAGIALLAWQVRATGVNEIARGFASVGAWGATVIMLLQLLRFGARSTGWTALLEGETPPGRALAAVVAGDATGNLTPLSMLVSEPAKAALLAWLLPSVGAAQALAALAAETFFFGVSVAIYSILGAAALLFAYDADISAPVRLASLITFCAMTIVLIVAAWVVLRKPTVAGALLARVPIPFVRRFAERVRSFERTAYATTAHPGARIGVVIAAASFFHVLSFAETWLTIWLLTGESLVVAAFVLDATGRLVNAVFKMIPLQLGVLQVGSELVANAIGLAPGIGVLVSLIRTARMIVWTGIGIAILGRHSLR